MEKKNKKKIRWKNSGENDIMMERAYILDWGINFVSRQNRDEKCKKLIKIYVLEKILCIITFEQLYEEKERKIV